MSHLKISLILLLLKEIFLHHFLYWKHISGQIKNTESFCSSYIYSLHLKNMLQAYSCGSKKNLCKGTPCKSPQGCSKAIAAPSAAQRRRKIINNTQTSLHLHTLQLSPNSMYCLYTHTKICFQGSAFL